MAENEEYTIEDLVKDMGIEIPTEYERRQQRIQELCEELEIEMEGDAVLQEETVEEDDGVFQEYADELEQQLTIEGVIQETLHEELSGNEVYFQEASHGKLKYSFRYGFNEEDGHLIKVVYDLKPEDIKMLGGNYENQRTVHQSRDPKELRQVPQKGHNDFTSKGTVLKIIDTETNKSLNKVTMKGAVGAPGTGAKLPPKEYVVGQKERVDTFKTTRAIKRTKNRYNDIEALIANIDTAKRVKHHNARGVNKNNALHYYMQGKRNVNRLLNVAKSLGPLVAKMPKDYIRDGIQLASGFYKGNTTQEAYNAIINEYESRLARLNTLIMANPTTGAKSDNVTYNFAIQATTEFREIDGDIRSLRRLKTKMQRYLKESSTNKVVNETVEEVDESKYGMLKRYDEYTIDELEEEIRGSEEFLQEINDDMEKFRVNAKALGFDPKEYYEGLVEKIAEDKNRIIVLEQMEAERNKNRTEGVSG